MKKIGRNDLCWCDSGLKYKKCHLNRSEEELVKMHEADKILQDEYKKGYCSAPEALKKECSGNIVKAHSVAKASSLQAVSDKGHVYGLKGALQNISKRKGSLLLEKIGINQASTFTGFCSKHDNDLFELIEKGIFSETKEECFLHAYRALCKEYFTKKNAKGLEGFRRKLDAGKPIEEQIAYQSRNNPYEIGLNAGMNDLLKRKSIFDNILLTKKFDRFNSFIIKFNTVPTVMATGGKNIIYDFDGKSLQNLEDLNKLPSAVFYNYFSSQKKGYVIFSWISSPDGVVDQFIASLMNIGKKEMTNALIRFIFSSCENLYTSPVWWEGLKGDKQKALMGRIKSATNLYEDYNAEYLKDDNVNYGDWDYDESVRL